MRKKQEDQTDMRHDRLASQYNEIGIKAVAAAIGSSRSEADDEKRSLKRSTRRNGNKDE